MAEIGTDDRRDLHSDDASVAVGSRDTSNEEDDDNDGQLLSTVRGPQRGLAGLLFTKMIRDEELRMLDKSQWYQCDLSTLSEDMRSKFVQLVLDEETASFLHSSQIKSDWVVTQLWYSFVRSLLSLFMTKTSINGLLGRGSMFVFSTSQFASLLGINPGWTAGSVLDLGAGDGRTTDVMAPFFQEAYVTEVSVPMRWTLASKKYHVLEVDEWYLRPRQFDVISCLNVLDRCEEPLTMLHNIKSTLTPDGVALLAVVIPFSPFVEVGANGNKPLEPLPIEGRTFEEQVSSVERDVLSPMGFELVSWSKVPYLCEGDLCQAFYWLVDAVFVVRLRDDSEGDIDVTH